MDSKKGEKCTAPLIIDCCQVHRDCFNNIKKHFERDVDERPGEKLTMNDLLSTLFDIGARI